MVGGDQKDVFVGIELYIRLGMSSQKSNAKYQLSSRTWNHKKLGKIYNKRMIWKKYGLIVLTMNFEYPLMNIQSYKLSVH
jgi:hypothetical protein